jgi:hypothetical protein
MNKKCVSLLLVLAVVCQVGCTSQLQQHSPSRASLLASIILCPEPAIWHAHRLSLSTTSSIVVPPSPVFGTPSGVRSCQPLTLTHMPRPLTTSSLLSLLLPFQSDPTLPAGRLGPGGRP